MADAPHVQVLNELGFTPDGKLAGALLAEANNDKTGAGSLSHNGQYEILGAWKKGDLVVHLERNTAPEPADDDGMTAVVTHPPLLVVEKGDVRVAVPPRDPEALRAVLTELA